MTELLKQQTEWNKALIVDEAGEVLGATVSVKDGEVKAFLSAFNDRDVTVGKGFVLCGNHFDVHRWYEDLIYGRRGDAERGEGICLHRVKLASGKYLYAIITYVLPTVSARAIPQLVEFAKKHCKLKLDLRL